MEERPVFSIIMPAYNKAHCISYAIKSVLRQTFTSWELIVVDDCSTDSTADVVAELNDPRIRLVRLERNSGGPSLPRNVGIELARGDWLCFLDPDDMYATRFLEHMNDLITTFGVSYFYCLASVRFKRFDGKVVATGLFHHGDVCDATAKRLPLRQYLYTRVGRPGAVNRDFVIKVGLRFPVEFRICEDYIFVVRLWLKGLQCIYTDVPLYLYGDTEEDSITRQRPYDQVIQASEVLLEEVDNTLKPLVRLDIMFYRLMKYVGDKIYSKILVNLIRNPSLLVYVLRKMYRKYFKEKLPLYLPKYRRCIDRIFADVP